MVSAMPEPLAGRLNVATLNTQGIPIRGSRLASRYAAIGAEFEATPPNVPTVSRHIRSQARLKGALVTRLADPGLFIVSTHPVANWDGDWSRASRFYPLHHAQLAALARTVRDIEGPAVVCGDFNVDLESSLFSEFMAETGLTDAFGGLCPSTFRAEFLPTGKAPHRIDFILTAAGSPRNPPGCCSPGRCPCRAASVSSLTTSDCPPAWPYLARPTARQDGGLA
jgi:hypothetical protein